MTTDTVLTSDKRDKFVGDLLDYGTDFVAPLYAVVESIEQAVLQSPEVQRLREDAGRYAWIRDDMLIDQQKSATHHSGALIRGEHLDLFIDDAIDAAISAARDGVSNG